MRCTLFGLLLLTAFVVASLTAEPGAWREAVAWARDWRQVSAAQTATCPVLVGAETPGDARASYDRAGDLALAIGDEEREALRAMLRDSTSRDQAMSLLARLPQSALQELHLATTRAGKVFSATRLGMRDDDLPFGDVLVLCDAVLVKARYAEAAQDRLHAWLDALACGWDLAGSEFPVGEMLGLVVVDRAMEVADAGWLRALPLQRLGELSVALAKVDRATPVTLDLRTVVAHMVLMVDETDDLQPFDIGMRSIYQSWDNMFSIEDAAIERVGRLFEQVQAFQRETPPDERWSAREVRLANLVLEDKMCNSDLRSGYLSYVLDGETNRRASVARMRLLRMAVSHLQGQKLVLGDPLGDGPLAVEHGDGIVRFFSAQRGLAIRLASGTAPK